MKNKKANAQIGAYVLESLTTGMYRNPLDVLREYVQNAFDSIRHAERSQVLKHKSGRINITIDNEKRCIKICDNGTGISPSEVEAKLLNIGMSSKNLDTDAGFRGIGRLAGLAYCDELIFKTQGCNQSVESKIIFNAKSIKAAMSAHKRDVEKLTDVIESNVNITSKQVKSKTHFFEVILNNIHECGEAFLSETTVHKYLSQVAPLGFDTQSFCHSKTFYDWIKAHHIEFPEVSIVITHNNQPYQVYKPYRKMTYKTAKDKHDINIRKLQFFPDDAGPDSPFWIWYADTNCPGVVDDDTVAGFRLRKTNIAIGDESRIAELFRQISPSYERFNNWYMGEVHIQDSIVIPNAHRDDFEDTPQWSKIKEQLLEFTNARCKEVRDKSEGRNADIGKLVTNTQKEIQKAQKKLQTGLASKAEQVKLVKTLDNLQSRLELAGKAKRSSEDKELINTNIANINKTKKQVSATNKFTKQVLNTSLDRKQRKIISDIIEMLYDVLDNKSFELARRTILTKYKLPDKK